MVTASSFGLYIHVPFCRQRCPYCAFAVVTGHDEQSQRYVEALCREIEWAASDGDVHCGPFDTIFFGGGTPSRLSPTAIEAILARAERFFGLSPAAEITLEANPTTAEAGRFRDLRQAGINRLSIGVQSLSDLTLHLLGRRHDAADAMRAFALARQAGFDSINTDLLFSVPAAPAQDLETTLERLLQIAPDHVSAYSLTVEEGTPFHRRRRRGDLPTVEDDEDGAAFALVQTRLRAAGFEHYEISNYARPGHRCRHNWDCWTGGEYLGVGLSAHSCVAGVRWWNVADLASYCEGMETGTSVRAGSEPRHPARQLEERIWLGLRTCEGVELDPAACAAVRASAPVAALSASGRMVLEGPRLRLRPEGFVIADAVAACVIDVLERAGVVTGEGDSR